MYLLSYYDNLIKQAQSNDVRTVQQDFNRKSLHNNCLFRRNVSERATQTNSVSQHRKMELTRFYFLILTF